MELRESRASHEGKNHQPDKTSVEREGGVGRDDGRRCVLVPISSSFSFSSRSLTEKQDRHVLGTLKIWL